jgi:hypothetical protein
MRIKLLRKFADALNGIDLTKANVGDVLNVKPHEAAILIAEGWAEEAAQNGNRNVGSQPRNATD